MEKEFVSYEQALSLKELGFDKPCFKYIYTGDTGTNCNHYLEVEPQKAKNYNEDDLCISQPLFSQAFKWFRQKYNLPSHIATYWQHDWNNYSYQWYVVENKKEYSCINHYKSYEEAESACIDELIELAKQQDNGR